MIDDDFLIVCTSHMRFIPCRHGSAGSACCYSFAPEDVEAVRKWQQADYESIRTPKQRARDESREATEVYYATLEQKDRAEKVALIRKAIYNHHSDGAEAWRCAESAYDSLTSDGYFIGRMGEPDVDDDE